MNLTQSPQQIKEELIREIFSLQHADDSAKMICLSTIPICIKCVEAMLSVCPEGADIIEGDKCTGYVANPDHVKLTEVLELLKEEI